jgi:hypothetical protein
MSGGSRNSSEFRNALAAVKAELDAIAKWNAAPHTLSAHAAREAGQLDLDWKKLSRKMQTLRATLSTSQHPAFDRCAQDITGAFGEAIMHATTAYDDQLNVTRGWREFWRDLDNALRVTRHYLDGLPGPQEASNLRPDPTGNPNVDVHINDEDTG